jgi:hypothetical protein
MDIDTISEINLIRITIKGWEQAIYSAIERAHDQSLDLWLRQYLQSHLDTSISQYKTHIQQLNDYLHKLENC